MVKEKVVRSSCAFCNAGCGVLIYLKDGKPIKVKGDPDNPISKGALCPKGQASLEFLDHPDRLKHPLKRLGEKGEGKWQQISWDEAFDTIAAKLSETKDKYGAESVVFINGAYKGGLMDGCMGRLATAFGTPNIAPMAPICFIPRKLASVITYGFYAIPDYEYPPACLVVWGSNKCETHAPECKRADEALDKSTKLIVIDPRETEFAKRANIWIKPRPTSDLALALGMLNVIINEDLFDKAFVEHWTVGFNKLKAHVQDYPPEKVEEITWVPTETLREAARLYAMNKPACISWGNGLDNNINNFQTARAIAILRAISGNITIPGGDIRWSPSGSVILEDITAFFLKNMISENMRQKKLNAKDRLLPIIFYALPQTIVKAILEGDPYPVHAVYLMGGSLLHTYSNASETYKALKKLDFLTVSDLFLTPAVGLADIVLPAATYLEFDGIYEPEPIFNSMPQIQRKVAQIGECRPDYQILLELAKRLGLEKFLWGDEREALDFILKPTGLTFEEAKKAGAISGVKQYRFHEVNGFETPSGKVELYSNRLGEWGFDPLPVYREPPETPYSDPELAKEYPLIFTNWKPSVFHGSQGRQIATLRGKRPDPLVEIHPKTASELGIEEGDWVYIETKRGRIKQKATLAPNIDPRVVFIDHGWWFPEKGASELYGWAESNINILTDNKPPYACEMGSATLRGILCKVYKGEGEMSQNSRPFVEFLSQLWVKTLVCYAPIKSGKNVAIWGKAIRIATQTIIAIRKGTIPRNMV